jgi:transcriptional regulator with XRE-family HTH domain
MKLHKNASLTPKQRQQIKNLYTTGEFTQEELATKFGVTRKTISKWVHSSSIEDSSNVPHKAKTITAEFIAAVKAYREDSITSHHGKVRIAFELKNRHTCSNPSNVYSVLKQLKLNQAKKVKEQTIQQIPVGKHRTQMDVQVLTAIEGNEGYEYKISIIHLSTRIKYSEIHSDYSSKTIAGVYERALDNLPPFL